MIYGFTFSSVIWIKHPRKVKIKSGEWMYSSLNIYAIYESHSSPMKVNEYESFDCTRMCGVVKGEFNVFEHE